MAAQTLTDCRLYVDGRDFSGRANALAIDHGAELVETTTFGSATRMRQGGLRAGGVAVEGLWQAGAGSIDAQLFAALGAPTVMTIAPGAGAEGERAFSLRVAAAHYAPGGAVGELLRFRLSAEIADGQVLAGTVAASRAVAASGSGDVHALGPVASGRALHAVLHVLAASGTSPTLDVSVQSDDALAFLSPVVRIAFPTMTAPGAAVASAAPSIDDHYRVAWTLGGTGTSFDLIVVLAIQ